MRIGLLEDDTSQIELISLWTKESGDELQFYSTGKQFRESMKIEDFDLLILDWHLPDTTGIDELDWLRKEKASNIPVIFITSRDDEASVVEALDHGADDFMVKPVNKAITLSRIQALQRRNKINRDDLDAEAGKSTAVESFDPYEIDQTQRKILLNGEEIKLTTKEFELAAFMFHNAGSLITRTQLLADIWGTTAELNTRTVDTHISRVRSKLAINPAVGWRLVSIYQRGYRLFKVTKE